MLRTNWHSLCISRVRGYRSLLRAIQVLHGAVQLLPLPRIGVEIMDIEAKERLETLVSQAVDLHVGNESGGFIGWERCWEYYQVLI
jgi:hypothetical protein